MFGRKRRDPDAEPRMSLTPEQRQRAHEHAMVKLRAAKAQYIAGKISFEQLWPEWWRTDILNRIAVPFAHTVRDLVLEAMELERARLMPATRYRTGGVIPPGRTVLLEHRGTDCVIPRAEVERLGAVATLPETMKPNLPTPRTTMQSTIATAVRGMTVDMYDGR